MVAKTLEICRMREPDLDGVLRIEELSFSSPWSRGMFLTELRDNPFSNLLVARLNEGNRQDQDTPVVGYCCFWLIFGEIHIMNLAVHPDHRRQRVACRLVEEILAVGRTQGIKKLHLEVRKSNDPARKLYEKYGFYVVGVRGKYYDHPREDALLMALDLDQEI